jgi:hypothetical protein
MKAIMSNVHINNSYFHVVNTYQNHVFVSLFCVYRLALMVAIPQVVVCISKDGSKSSEKNQKSKRGLFRRQKEQQPDPDDSETKFTYDITDNQRQLTLKQPASEGEE